MNGIMIAIFAGVVALLALLGFRIVPQGYNFVVQRLGRYHRTLSPGLNFIVPFIDSVAAKLPTKEIVLDVPSQEVITRDNAVIVTSAVAFIQITRPDRALYGIMDFRQAIENLVQTTLRSIIGGTELDRALSSREEIRAKLKEGIADNIEDWGVTLKNVEIQDIKPSESMQGAMEEQAAAERMRRATVTRAEGEKTAAILEAEGRMEAARRDAQARIVLAEASAKSIRMVSEAVHGEELPALYLLGDKYVQAISDLAESENAKTVLLPADLPAAVRGLFGREKG